MHARRLLVHCKYLPAIFIIYWKSVQTWRTYDLEVASYRYEIWDHKVVNFCNFTLLKNKQRHVISGSMTFGINVTELMCEATVTMQTPNAKPITLVNSTVNTCQAFTHDQGNILRIIVQQFRKGRSFWPDCPVPANQLITIENFYVDADLLPPYMPDSQYETQFFFLIDKKYVFKVFSNGSIFSKRKKNVPKAGKKHVIKYNSEN